VTGAGQGLFAGTGAIGRYWQARCVGFEVRSVEGERVGVVTRVGINPESRRVHSLHVRAPRRRDALELEPASVAFVDPWERVLIVEQADEEGAVSEAPTIVKAPTAVTALPVAAARAAPIAWHRAVPVGVAAAKRAGVMARSGGAMARSAGSTAASAAPPLGRVAVWLGKRTAYAAAFLVWLYGAVVFLLARVVARVLFVCMLALSVALGWVGPRLWSSTKKVAGQARDLSTRNSFSSR
jgi:hypothetical protein